MPNKFDLIQCLNICCIQVCEIQQRHSTMQNLLEISKFSYIMEAKLIIDLYFDHEKFYSIP